MADYTITISESLNVFGPAPSDKWSEYNWNAFKWGEGTNIVLLGVGAVLSDTPTLSDAFSALTDVSLSDSITPSDAVTNETLTDSNGYTYVFTGNTTNAVNRASTTYTQQTSTAPVWTSGTGASTTWSQVS